MDIEYGVRGKFSATHKGCRNARWPHGHRYLVEITITGDLDPQEGMIRGSETINEALRAYLDTLDLQNLEDVLPAASSTPVGLATSFLGEFVARYPRITEVAVRSIDTGETGRVRRTPRVL